MVQAEDVIKFQCENCGGKICAPKTYAGQEIKCPKCGGAIFIANQSDIKKDEESDSSTNKNDYELLQKLYGQKTITEEEIITKRKFPWIIDIFLYPLNKYGLITFGFIFGIPFFMLLVMKFSFLLTTVFSPALAFFALFAILRILADIIFYLYTYWYFSECIRSSSDGNTRAPDTLVNNPNPGQLFWGLIRLIICASFLVLPALLYYKNIRETDKIFLVLFGCGVFLFPMVVLAVTMFDSFQGLNPILIIGSIFKTFFPYLFIVMVYYGVLMVPIIAVKMVKSSDLPYLSFVFFGVRMVSIYLFLIAGHLLGRFYWRYENKLQWDF